MKVSLKPKKIVALLVFARRPEPFFSILVSVFLHIFNWVKTYDKILASFLFLFLYPLIPFLSSNYRSEVF